MQITPLNEALARSKAEKGLRSPFYSQPLNAINRLQLYGTQIGNQDTIVAAYLLKVAQANKCTLWPQLRMTKDTTETDLVKLAKDNLQRIPLQNKKTLLFLYVIQYEGWGHLNVVVGSTESMQFFHYEPHGAGAGTAVSAAHSAYRPRLIYYLKAISPRATLVEFTESCPFYGPQVVNQRALSRTSKNPRDGICTLWSILFAKKILELGNINLAKGDVFRVQEAIGAEKQHKVVDSLWLAFLGIDSVNTSEARRQKALAELLNMTESLAWQGRDKLGNKSTTIKLSKPEKLAYIPGYVSPSEKIARALKSAVKQPLGVYLLRLEHGTYDKRKLFALFSSEQPVHKPTLQSIAVFRSPPFRAENNIIYLYDFADMILTMMCKSFDHLSAVKFLESRTYILSTMSQSTRLRAVKHVHEGLRDASQKVEFKSSYRTPNPLAQACYTAFCKTAPLLRAAANTDKLFRNIESLPPDEQTLAGLVIACVYFEATGNSWPRSALLHLLEISEDKSLWQPLLIDTELRERKFAAAESQVKQFFERRQFSMRWTHTAGIAAAAGIGGGAMLAVGVLLSPIAVGSVGGSVLGASLGGASYSRYYKLDADDVAWLTDLSTKLADDAINVGFVVDDSSTATFKAIVGNRVHTVTLSDNQGSRTAWVRSYVSKATDNAPYHTKKA